MQRDAVVLAGVADRETLGHVNLFTWPEPCATLGCLASPPPGVSPVVIRRPTGGGLILHGSDLSLSYHLGVGHPAFHSPPAAIYSWIHALMIEVLVDLYPIFKGKLSLLDTSGPKNEMGCWTCAAAGDVMLEGRKCAGSGQRRQGGRFLQQTSLLVYPISKGMIEGLWSQPEVYLTHLKQASIPLCDYTEVDFMRIMRALDGRFSHSLATLEEPTKTMSRF